MLRVLGSRCYQKRVITCFICVCVLSRWYSVPAHHSSHSSGTSGWTSYLTPDNTHQQHTGEEYATHRQTYAHSHTNYRLFSELTVCVQLQLQLNQDLSSFFTQEDSSPKSNKRGVLPKSATNIMRTWLFQHIGVSKNTSRCKLNTRIPCTSYQPFRRLE